MFTKNEQNGLLNVVADALRASLTSSFGRPIEVTVTDADDDSGKVVLALDLGELPLQFDVEIRSSVSPATLARLSTAGSYDRLILVTPRLTARAMEVCRKLGLGCADADGNLFLRAHSAVVDIGGRPAVASRELVPGADTGARLIGRSGLQIVFTLLAAPDLRNGTFRDIAAVSGTSLGSVATVVKALERGGYVTATSQGRALRKAGNLLDLWAEGYRVRLFDRLRLGTFTTDTPQWWSTAGDATLKAGGQWGGETALWATGQNLRPARGIMYVDIVPTRLVAALRLSRDAGSDAPVEFRQRFWDASAMDDRAVVPAALVYADLLADGDPRLVEAAAQLRRTNSELVRLDES